jgi:uncharacterized protein (TIGR03437 family)
MDIGRRDFFRAGLGAAAYPWWLRAEGLVAIRQPYLQNVSGSHATIRWATAEPGDSWVELAAPAGTPAIHRALTTHYDSSRTGLSSSYYQHTVRLESLTSGAEYRYRAFTGGTGIPSLEWTPFRTAGPGSFRFLALGDSGFGGVNQGRVAALMQREPASFVIHTGDLAYPDGTFFEFEQRYLDFYQAMMRHIPFFPCLGNHDYYSAGGDAYLAIHDLPVDTVPEADCGRYYSFDWGDVHFVSLDSNRPLDEAVAGRGPMLKWLDADLARTQKFWRVVFFHHPPYATGPNWEDPLCGHARAMILPILRRHGVSLVLNGHEHSYQRTIPMDGTVYVVTGGGGATLYHTEPAPWLEARHSAYHYLRAEVQGSAMRIEAVGIDGGILDRFLLQPPPIVRGSVVNAASGTPLLGLRGLATVFGHRFNLETTTVENGDVQVVVGGRPARLLFLSPSQINFQLPDGLLGSQTVRVVTSAGASTAEIEILPVAPAIFHGGLFENDHLQISSATPCRQGGRVAAYLTGLAAHEGPVKVRVGDASVPGVLQTQTAMPGVQKVVFDVPSLVTRGLHTVSVEAGGVESNAEPLPVG